MKITVTTPDHDRRKRASRFWACAEDIGLFLNKVTKSKKPFFFVYDSKYGMLDFYNSFWQRLFGQSILHLAESRVVFLRRYEYIAELEEFGVLLNKFYEDKEASEWDTIQVIIKD